MKKIIYVYFLFIPSYLFLIYSLLNIGKIVMLW